VTTTLPLYAAAKKNALGADNDDNTSRIAEFGAQRRDPQWQERSQHWILLVDDEEDLRLAVGQYLDDQGYQVTACADAATALAMARQRRPSLIVSDVRMPGGMDGLDFLQSVRADAALVDLPVVLLTARGQTRDRIAGYNAGADAYIPKPFEPTELVSVLDNLLARQKLISDSSVNVEDLQRSMADIKHLLLEKGGGGAGVGDFVEATNVFLAPDERQVLDYLCQGLPNKEIAAASFLSTRRVEQLLTSLYRKTAVSNRTELVRWAVRTGTIRL
jgi:DNA-binding NarL/FixJ family response regulator